MVTIGIDLGTSSMKLMLVNSQGEILNSVTEEYPIEFPRPGWAEQRPEDWKRALFSGVNWLLHGFDASGVGGIGVGGQMHGLVALDENDNVIRPAILWNDSRTDAETEYLNTVIGKEKLSKLTANIAFAGFTAPKLLWMAKNEPENFRRIRKIMLPKDYINYVLTGVHATDYSDASGMLLLDVEHRCWSHEMLEICGITEEVMPRLFESWEVVGTVKPETAAALGLPESVKVVAGAGDNAAAAVGTGTVGDSACNISLGTSGTVFISSGRFIADPKNALHSFCHADGSYHLLGCMLSAASCNKWFCEEILGTSDFASEQEGMEDRLGKNGVFFLPYLMGERSPINDTDVRGSFFGLSLATDRLDMVQAVLEGVAFAIRDSFEVVKEAGVSISRSRLCGGGAKSPVWRRIMTNVLGIPLEILKTEQGPGMGGAMLAMVGCGEFSSVGEAAEKLVSVAFTEEPEPELAARYEEKYRKFRQIYPAVMSLYKKLR